MNRKLLSLTTIIISAIALSSCGNKKPAAQNPAMQAASVLVYQVGEEKVTGIDTYPGTVVSLNEVELRAEVGGYITAIYVKDGQAVTKGQQLYEINRTKYLANFNQAQANLKIAKANLDKAKKDADRYTKLAQQDAIAKQRVDYALTDVNNAASQVAAAEATVSSAAFDLKRSVITAPVSGNVGISQVRLGGLVSPGSTLLNTISSNDPIAVDIPIGEQEIPRFIKLQQKAGAKADSLFTIQFTDRSVYKASGHITAIDRAVDPQTGTIKVRVSFANPEHRLRAGMNCTLRVLNQDTGVLTTIPFKALTEQMGEYYVYIANGDKVTQRKVAIGSRVADKVVIRDGLKVGETIVSDGVQNLREGASIQIADPSKPAAKPAGK